MITIVGIGPGKRSLILNEALKSIKEAEIVVGSNRQLGLFSEVDESKKKRLPKKLIDLKDYLLINKEKNCVVLASGDPMLYGIGNWLSKEFGNDVRIVSGLSAMQYLFAKAHLSMNECYLSSTHGKTPDLSLLLSLPKVALVTDESFGPYELAQASLKEGQSKKFLIGENLSYENEEIQWYEAKSVPKRKYDMNVVVMVDA